MEPAWIALIGTIAGTVGLKLTEHWLGKNRTRSDDASRIRDELRIEITAQREEINKLEADRDKWREEYYDLRDEISQLKVELASALKNIKLEAQNAENKLPEESP